MRHKSFKIFKRTGCLFLALTMIITSIVVLPQKVEAATSYTNAMEFYYSTGGDDTGANHIEVYNGVVYYATKAKLASSSSNLKYQTIGFDITLTGNGKSTSFAVKRGGSLGLVNSTSAGGFEYLLYSVPYSQMVKLAQMHDLAGCSGLFDGAAVFMRMDAIITTKKGTSIYGNVEENGYGGLNESGTVWHLNNPSHLAAAKSTFSGHTFGTYININKRLINNQLTISYNLNGGNVSATGYNISANGLLYKGSAKQTTKARQMQSFNLISAALIGANRTGYHLDNGKEWEYSSREYSQSATYMPSDFSADVSAGNRSITVNANWKPNPYTVIYDANGGEGYMNTSNFVYDAASNLRSFNFTKTGYHMADKAWNTRPDGSGTSYTNEQAVMNLTAQNGGTVTLYAQWEPDVYVISTNTMGGNGGTDKFYEKYEHGWYADFATTSAISGIAIPTRRGYRHLGYYTGVFSFGDKITEEEPDRLAAGFQAEMLKNAGKILRDSNYFTSDRTVYSDWEAKKYKVTFDKQGGTGGTDSAIATYGQPMPLADAPTKDGYTFKGYFSEKNGKGTQYYNEFMASMLNYMVDSDMTLYAYWKDETPPTLSFTPSYADWTNQVITLTADATDKGSGLSSVTIYDTNNNVVASKTNLKGKKSCAITYNNPKEGAIMYHAVAIDMDGNQIEKYCTVFYDVTAPRKDPDTNVSVSGDYGNFSVTINADDYNVK